MTIVEILGRSEQGITRPFLCRGDDDGLYYVKGRGAGLRSLCCEWVAGRLAQEFGLQIPRFEIAQVPSSLLCNSDRLDLSELGRGPVFASAKVCESCELTWEEAAQVPPEVMADIFIFDWWVQNEDRSLSALGGNPNLLIGAVEDGPRRLWAFDFNLAFDPGFDANHLREVHAFSRLLEAWPLGYRETCLPRLERAYQQLPAIYATLPKEWLHLDGDPAEPVQLAESSVREILQRAFHAPIELWNP